MSTYRTILGTGFAALAAGGLLWASTGSAQLDAGLGDPTEKRAEYERAKKAAAEAQARGEKFARQAHAAKQAAEKTAREAAALAAQVQQAEAGIAASEARIDLIAQQRGQIDARLAERRQPIVRLTAALQNMARRPLVLSALRPGSLRDTVYVRAVLETTVPEIRTRTASLRGELQRARELEAEAQQALGALRSSEGELEKRRRELAAIETRQRLASRKIGGVASRETDRAIALAEEARDLNDLVGQLGKAASLRSELAALPGPIMRPPRPSASQVIDEDAATPEPRSTGAPAGLQLPVQGRTVTGFGVAGTSGVQSEGIVLAPRAGAQIVAPAGGRVAFAGPYRGFGSIVIIEHPGSWTSLVTGLARSDVSVGDELVGGSPLGIAGRKDAEVTYELRRNGAPVNPLQFIG